MASLLDLGPLTEEIDVRGTPLTVRGLTAAHLFKLIAEFPGLPVALQQMGSDNTVAILQMTPDLFAKIIAIVTGSPGDPKAEAIAGEMGAGDQMKILGAVQRLSFPQGFLPFVEEMTRLVGTSPPSGPASEQGNSSHEPSSAQLHTDSPGLMRGISPRAN